MTSTDIGRNGARTGAPSAADRRRSACRLVCIATLAAVDGAVLLAALRLAEGAGAVPAGPAIALRLVPVMAACLAWFWIRGHYARRLPFWTETRDMLAVVGTALAVAVLRSLLDPNSGPGGAGHAGWMEPLVWSGLMVAIPAGRCLAKRALSRLGLRRLDVLVVGSEPAAGAVEAALASDRSLGLRVVDRLHPATGDRPGPWRWSGAGVPPTALERSLQESRPDLVVVATQGWSGAELDSVAGVLERCAVEHVMASPPPCRAIGGLGLPGHDILLFSPPSPHWRAARRMAKRVFDLTAGTAALLVALPLFAILACLVAWDGGPVLYAHRRIGRDGRDFRCLKFRTMVVDADRLLTEHLARDPAAAAQWRDIRKLKSDPRVTRIGRLLRGTGLDEIPQILNVLRGEMSLVGPRPIVEEEAHHYGDRLGTVIGERPGITGLWQVSGRNDLDYARRVELDLWYVRNRTLWIDAVIMLRTVPALLSQRGAY